MADLEIEEHLPAQGKRPALRMHLKHTVDPQDGYLGGAVHAHHGEHEVGYMPYGHNADNSAIQIGDMVVTRPYRRRGVASAMLDFARAKGVPVVHNTEGMTSAGQAFMRGYDAQRHTAMGQAGPDYHNLRFETEKLHANHVLLHAVHPEHGRVGVVGYGPTDQGEPGSIGIAGIDVPEEHQRRGVASQLMGEIERRHPGTTIYHSNRSNEGNAWAEHYYGPEASGTNWDDDEDDPHGGDWEAHPTRDRKVVEAMGQAGPDYHDLTFTHSVAPPEDVEDDDDYDRQWEHHRFDAHHDGENVGHITIEHHPSEDHSGIWGLQVHPDHRRRGVARQLLDHARTHPGLGEIRHSDFLTDEGRGWADSVGGPRIAMGQAGPDYDNLTFHQMTGETYGLHPDNHHHQMLFARHPDHGYVGHVRFTEEPDHVKVHNLDVWPEHQRRGVASQLMGELERRNPGTMIDHGVRSPHGTQWAKSYYGPEHEGVDFDNGWTITQPTRDRQLVGARHTAVAKRCPCGMAVQWDPIDGWQHADGSISHDGQFFGKSVSDLVGTTPPHQGARHAAADPLWYWRQHTATDEQQTEHVLAEDVPHQGDHPSAPSDDDHPSFFAPGKRFSFRHVPLDKVLGHEQRCPGGRHGAHCYTGDKWEHPHHAHDTDRPYFEDEATPEQIAKGPKGHWTDERGEAHPYYRDDADNVARMAEHPHELPALVIQGGGMNGGGHRTAAWREAGMTHVPAWVHDDELADWDSAGARKQASKTAAADWHEFRRIQDSVQQRYERPGVAGSAEDKDRYFGTGEMMGHGVERQLTPKDWITHSRGQQLHDVEPEFQEHWRGHELGYAHGVAGQVDHEELEHEYGRSPHPEHFSEGYADGLESAMERVAVMQTKDRPALVALGHVSGNTIDALHCFAGETRFLTRDGSKTLEECAGQVVQVLTGFVGNTHEAWWADAMVHEFGEQPVLNVVLTRNKQTKIVRATADHDWFVGRPGGFRKVKTTDLRAGHRLPHLRRPRHLGEPDHDGIRYGFVFGDGTIVHNRATAQAHVTLWGAKTDLAKYFDEVVHTRAYERETPNGVHGLSYSSGMPGYHKELPSLAQSPGFLYGWLAGYFAADGEVSAKQGQCSLSSASLETLQYVRDIATSLGIGTYAPTTKMRKGYGPELTAIHTLGFSSTDLDDSFFLREDQRAAHRPQGHERMGWTVVAVEDYGEIETVYCPRVPGTEAFVLEDNILTGNCPFCGSGSVTARSDGSIECGFCTAAYTVQVQPEYSAFPMSVDGNPYPFPGRDDMGAQLGGAVPGAEMDGDGLDEDGGGDDAPPWAQDGADGSEGSDGDADAADDSDGGDEDDEPEASVGGKKAPPFTKKTVLHNARGTALSLEDYQRHLAIVHAQDPRAMAQSVKAERQAIR